MRAELIFDSNSVGDPACFRTLADLGVGLDGLPSMDADRGRVALIVRRGEQGMRDAPERVMLTPEEGVTGDSWNRKEGATSESQITVMRTDVAELIAGGQPLTLLGDNLFLDLDVTEASLPPGTRVRIGDALLEVTIKKHKGCRKFAGRFGVDALRFVSTPEGRARNLRGLYMRVVTAGEAGPGDPVQVIERATLSEEAII